MAYPMAHPMAYPFFAGKMENKQINNKSSITIILKQYKNYYVQIKRKIKAFSYLDRSMFAPIHSCDEELKIGSCYVYVTIAVQVIHSKKQQQLKQTTGSEILLISQLMFATLHRRTWEPRVCKPPGDWDE